MRRRIAFAGLALAASVVLVGCSQSPAEAELERTAGPADVLPDWVMPPSEFVVDSVRLLGEREGTTYYLAEAESLRVDNDFCIVAVAEESLWTAGCFGNRGGGGGGGQGLRSWEFNPAGWDDDSISDGFTLVHRTLAVGG